MKNFQLTISKRGLPCLWESGGGASNTGDAIIIAGPTGEPLAPIYIRRSGQLSNGEHALIPVEKDCLIIEADHHRGDFTTRIFRLTGIRTERIVPGLPARSAGGFGTNPPIPERTVSEWSAYPVAEFSNGEWDKPEAAAAYSAAIKAAEGKASCYHCREPHYIEDGDNKPHQTMVRVGHCSGLGSVGFYDKPAPATLAQARRAVRIAGQPLATHWDSESQEYLRDATA